MRMKAKDLIAILSRCDEESDVIFQMISGCCGDWEDLDIAEMEEMDYGNNGKFVRIQFSPLPGYKSCIQSSGTKRSDKEYWKDKKSD